MERLNCIIVDDEPIARRGMRRLIGLRDELHAIGSASSVAEAEKLVSDSSEKIDLLFLDIDMEGESGLEYARRMPKGLKVVFTTAFSDYALDSYDVEAVDYLLKPIREERFNRAVDRVLQIAERENMEGLSSSHAPNRSYITVKADRKYIRLNINDILYIEGLGDYLVIHLFDRRLTTRMTFKKMEEELTDTPIIRVNKSYMVNSRHIESFATNEIKIGDCIIPVGVTYKETVNRALMG
ncbi:MAG: LytTR family DNA-binding domain-containing protein [Muribaculaceae bacterium]|nr:LytTR family DNA-binding domain-containing protein [Muribaculaceae bacterium]